MPKNLSKGKKSRKVRCYELSLNKKHLFSSKLKTLSLNYKNSLSQ